MFPELNSEIDFFCLDVETANASFASICQIGLVAFKNREVVYSAKRLVDPEEEFDGYNISIHGVDSSQVFGAPTYAELGSSLHSLIKNRVTVYHNAFDRSACNQASQKYGISAPECIWLDSAKVARRTWEDVERRGYGLLNLANKLGIEFVHHDPVEDAIAAGKVIYAAIEQSGMGVDDWLIRAEKPIHASSSRYPESITLDGDADGPLYGETIVFTGALQMSRGEAARVAAKLGCNVKPNVSKKVTLLCVGDQDLSRLAGHKRSSKHRKALELIEGGHNLKILNETDFLSMMHLID